VAARFAADAGVMQIQLREDSVWRPSWDVRASTAANGEGGNVDKYSQVLWKDDVARREEKISWASRHNGTAHAETSSGFVMFVVISCGDGVPCRWRTKLDFISGKPFDDPHWSAAFGAEPERTGIIRGGGFLLGWGFRAQ
jgi:hypothetical protein